MRFRDLETWLDWQVSAHATEIDLGLERVAEVAKRLRVLVPGRKVITVAGTNGKGSSVALLEGMLERAGYHTGCYTSPHILHYRERIRLQGTEVSDELIVKAFAAIDEARADVSLTYFEWSTLAGLWIFTQADVDVAILEVGLGGRLDAVNVVDADIGLISSIGLDHTEWLGDTRELICREKAGIARQGRPLVYAGTQPPKSCLEYVSEWGAKVFCRGTDFDISVATDDWTWSSSRVRRAGLPFPALRGQHQIDNAAGVMMVLDLLGLDGIDDTVIHAALQEVTLSGRFERMDGTFQTVFDVAHNADGSQRLAEVLKQTPAAGQRWCLLGVLADKDAHHMFGALEKEIDHWLLVSPDSPRALPLEQLESIATERVGKPHFDGVSSVEAGLTLAQQNLEKDDQLVVTGSFYTVGQFKAALGAYNKGVCDG